MSSKGLTGKRARKAQRSPKGFAERLARIVRRWSTVYVQQPRVDTGLWMSRARSSKTDTEGPSETK